MRKRAVTWGAGMALVLFAVTSAAGDTFEKHKKWLQVGPSPRAIVAVDLNEDGLPEIVTADTGSMRDPREEKPANDELSFLVALGNLEYERKTPFRAGFAPYAVAVANMDALKAPDLVVVSFMAISYRDVPTRNLLPAQDVALFRNMGDGLFESIYYHVPDEALPYNRVRDGDEEPVFTKPGLTSLAVGQLDGDRQRDVVATAWSSDALVFLPGSAETYLGEARTMPAPGGPRDVKVADFDKDGLLDLAVVLYSSHELGLWRGDGAGAFEPATRFDTRGKLPTKLQVGDINGDGRLDLAVSHCYTDDSIVLFYGDGGFSFSTSQEILLGEHRDILEREIRDLLVADLNGDDKPDLAAACYGSAEVAVLLNASESSALPQRFEQETYAYEEAKPRALCAADFNADGATDLGVALWEANAVSLLLGKPTKAKE